MKPAHQAILAIFIISLIAVALFFLPKTSPQTKQQSAQDSVEALDLSVTQPDKTIADLVAGKAEPSPLAIAPQQESQAPALQIDLSKNYQAYIKTTHGSLVVDLFVNEAPIAVNNFIVLAANKFYDNTKFHRIIKNFMVQGGDPKGDGTGGPGYTFKDEPITRDYTRGIVAMANRGPNTNGSQFFIVTKDANLPKQYVIFGALNGDESFATLDKLASVPVTTNPSGENSLPTVEVSIKSINIKALDPS